MDRHIQVFHNRSRLSKCDRCDYVGSSAGALTRHIQVVHLNMLKFQCEKCEFKTMKRSDIVKHMIDKHDIGNFFYYDRTQNKYIHSFRYNVENFFS